MYHSALNSPQGLRARTHSFDRVQSGIGNHKKFSTKKKARILHAGAKDDLEAAGSSALLLLTLRDLYLGSCGNVENSPYGHIIKEGSRGREPSFSELRYQ